MTPFAHPRRWTTIVASLLAFALLAGCASQIAYRDANRLLADNKPTEGLAKLEEAVKLDPKNAEYRMALSTTRTSLVNRYLRAAEAHRREGRLTEAEKWYRQAMALDSDNPMAQQGLQALVVERKHRLVVAEGEELLKRGKPEDLTAAIEMLRPVLIENPRQREALNLKERIDEAQNKQSKPESRLAENFRKTITLEFRDAPLRTVFDVISKVSGLNFFFDKDIRPDLKANIMARNTTIEDAVRLLMVTNQLEQKVLNENSILIYPNTAQKLKDYQTLTVRTFYLANADVKAVSNTIKTIVKTKDVVIDERLGLIIMRDTPDAIRMAERIVALQDLTDPEVMLEVEVVEMKRSRLLELGINWPNQMSLSPLLADGVPLVLSDLSNLNRDNIQVGIGSVTINARKEDGDVSILANPRIRVRNREKAKILIGDRVPVITTTSNVTGFVSESINYVDVGLKLEVEPNIYLDEEVAIKVNLEVSSLVREVFSKSGSLAYQIGTRGASTVLRLKDGETQILAGLISDEDRSSGNKVPGLGELPVAGRLFGSQKDDTTRSEILLSITPRVVRSIRRPDLQSAEFESGTESNIGARPLQLGSREPASPQTQGPPASAATTKPPAAPAADPSASAVPSAASAVAPVNAQSASKVDAATPAGGPVSLSWQAPKQVKVGEQFSAVLRVNSQQTLRGLPLLVSFDPQVMQVMSAQEGDFFKQAGGKSNFKHRVDGVQGKVFISALRENPAGGEAGINGTGSVTTLTFKAVKATHDARLKLLSATPEPAASSAIPVPIEQVFKIVP
ncbi:secretin N-terminal domain-containing protein [Variovorax sp. Sphag1AA]|uniref:secretin N-terminal domain-containing protein n=1 Tax=Variovorax sp. Sphag1AA TaxID=2587027 RepID=UPI0016177F55|nr:secretin N-terminal domain-containing protein [Variovorax sp. Sphag1AA]MBB3176028.1 general secretion pathway protein D [Variovorax sp. Sphag1AA]